MERKMSVKDRKLIKDDLLSIRFLMSLHMNTPNRCTIQPILIAKYAANAFLF